MPRRPAAQDDVAPGDDAPDWFDEADLLAAIGAATSAAAQDGAAHAADVERMRLWHWLKDSALLGATPGPEACVDLAFDTSHLRRRVADAAAHVVVRLHDGRAMHRAADGERALGPALDDFRVRGIGTEGASVVLRPLGKGRGHVVLAFSAAMLVEPDGAPLDIDVFRRWIERYWWD